MENVQDLSTKELQKEGAELVKFLTDSNEKENLRKETTPGGTPGSRPGGPGGFDPSSIPGGDPAAGNSGSGPHADGAGGGGTGGSAGGSDPVRPSDYFAYGLDMLSMVFGQAGKWDLRAKQKWEFDRLWHALDAKYGGFTFKYSLEAAFLLLVGSILFERFWPIIQATQAKRKAAKKDAPPAVIELGAAA